MTEVDSLGNELTQEQINYFRNSKIRNKQGKLLVCYHATSANFDAFDKSFIGSGNGGANFGSGFYFTPDSYLASEYGEAKEYYLNITNPFEYYTTDKNYVVSMLQKSGVDYDKEFVDNFDYDNLWDEDLLDNFLPKALKGKNPYAELSKTVQSAGFDGIQAGDEIIAFEPNQIKLVTNKQPTNSNKLTEDTNTQVDSEGNSLTPEQVKFFADSKVRDNKGNLLVCYHNTDSEFDIFDKHKVRTGTFGNGFYSTTSKGNASSYGGKFTKQYYLNITKPAFIDEQYEDIHEYLEGEFGVDDFNVLLEQGYDGIVTPMYWGEDMFEYYVALEPNQIKLATNKQPTNSDRLNENRKEFKEPMNITNTGAVDISKFTFTNYRNPDGQSHPKCKTYRSTLEYMASETERLFNSCLKNYWGETKPYDQLTIEYMNLNRHSCTRDIVGAGSEEGLKDARDAILKRQGELLEKAKEYTKWDFKTRQWVKETTPTNESFAYQMNGMVEDAFYTFERDNITYHFFFTPSKRERDKFAILAVDYGIRFDKEPYENERGTTTIPFSRVYDNPQQKGYFEFTPETHPELVNAMDEDDRKEYRDLVVAEIANQMAINESNELEQRAKKHKKKSKGMGWHMAVNAGDVEKGIEVFNNSTSLGSREGTPMGEAVEKKTYVYDGIIYYDGKRERNIKLYTEAETPAKAISNILWKVCMGDRQKLHRYDLDDSKLICLDTKKVKPKKQVEDDIDDEPHICDVCGFKLTDGGYCPICDHNERYDDLVEELTNLEAFFNLRDID